MKTFLLDTLTGGVLFLLPLVLIIMLLVKAHEILSQIVAPLADILPDFFFGFDGSRTVALILLILICFLSGLMFRSAFIRQWIEKVEENFLYLIPGYALIKAITSDAIGKSDEHNLVPVVYESDGTKKIGFLAEEYEDSCVVFFPEPTKSDSGEVVILPKHAVRTISASTNTIAKSLKRFGKGLGQYAS